MGFDEVPRVAEGFGSMVVSWLVGGRAVTGWCLVVMVVDCGLSWAGEGGRESQSESGRGKKNFVIASAFLIERPNLF